MTDTTHQREQASLHKLSAVSRARQVRLRNERQVLIQRERVMEVAEDRQSADEALLSQQRAVELGRWQSWVRAGGALREAVALRRDRVLLMDMAALLGQHRKALQDEANQMSLDLRAWAQRWRSTQVFDESLATRAHALRVTVERATERQRDEETLAMRASARDGTTQAVHGI